MAEMDGLLGCPISLHPLDSVVGGFKSNSLAEQINICCSLFLAIDWVREVLNCFSDQKEDLLRAKVLQQVGNLGELEKIFDRCLSEALQVLPHLIKKLSLPLVPKPKRGHQVG